MDGEIGCNREDVSCTVAESSRDGAGLWLLRAADIALNPHQHI